MGALVDSGQRHCCWLSVLLGLSELELVISEVIHSSRCLWSDAVPQHCQNNLHSIWIRYQACLVLHKSWVDLLERIIGGQASHLVRFCMQLNWVPILFWTQEHCERRYKKLKERRTTNKLFFHWLKVLANGNAVYISMLFWLQGYGLEEIHIAPNQLIIYCIWH